MKKINNSLLRTDEIHWLNNDTEIDWVAPIIADAEAGFGGNLNAYELMKHFVHILPMKHLSLAMYSNCVTTC